jgi:hypothetical protein
MEQSSNPADTYDPHAVAERLRTQAARYRNMGDINAATEAEQAAAVAEMGDSDDARRIEQTFNRGHGDLGDGLSTGDSSDDVPNSSGSTGDQSDYSGAASSGQGTGDVSAGIGSSSGPGPSAGDESDTSDEGGDEGGGEIEERGPARYLP